MTILWLESINTFNL